VIRLGSLLTSDIGLKSEDVIVRFVPAGNGFMLEVHGESYHELMGKIRAEFPTLPESMLYKLATCRDLPGYIHRLSDDEATEIFARVAEGESYTSIADKIGRSKQTIMDLVKGRKRKFDSPYEGMDRTLGVSGMRGVSIYEVDGRSIVEPTIRIGGRNVFLGRYEMEDLGLAEIVRQKALEMEEAGVVDPEQYKRMYKDHIVQRTSPVRYPPGTAPSHCTISGCMGKHVAKGLCGKHYQQAKNKRLGAFGSNYRFVP
jgi:hypothetical protein